MTVYDYSLQGTALTWMMIAFSIGIKSFKENILEVYVY